MFVFSADDVAELASYCINWLHLNIQVKLVATPLIRNVDPYVHYLSSADRACKYAASIEIRQLCSLITWPIYDECYLTR